MIYIVSLFIVSVSYSLPSTICVNSTTNYKMFGSALWADYINTPFIMAFNDADFINYKIYSAKNEFNMVDQISKITETQCPILLGLFTSQDCLIAGEFLKKNNVIALSSSCSNDLIKKYYPHIYSMTPNQLSYSKVVAEYINDADDVNDIYAFYQPSDIYSRDGFKYFERSIKKQLIPIEVKSNGSFKLKQLFGIKKNKVYYVFFTYPLPSAQIISKLDNYHLIDKNITIIGASSWIFQLSVFHSMKSILKKANHLLTPNLIDKKKVALSKFSMKFEEKFHRKPDVVELLTYDATKLAIKCYRKARSHNNLRLDFLHCLRNDPHEGITGVIHFPADSPFAQRKVYLDNLMGKL